MFSHCSPCHKEQLHRLLGTGGGAGGGGGAVVVRGGGFQKEGEKKEAAWHRGDMTSFEVQSWLPIQVLQITFRVA